MKISDNEGSYMVRCGQPLPFISAEGYGAFSILRLIRLVMCPLQYSNDYLADDLNHEFEIDMFAVE